MPSENKCQMKKKLSSDQRFGKSKCFQKALIDQVSFTINDVPYTVKPDGLKITATTSLNAFIRNVAQLKGTKMMCLEGGCGSCVVTAEFIHPVTKQNTIVAVNSCLVTVLSCQDWKITTVEGIGNKKNGYNAIQQRLAQFNGTQCGFCSPGMIMNMYSLNESQQGLTQKQIENSFGGNICRCTGYRSIADAFKSLAVDASPKLLAKCADLEEMDIFCLKTGKICQGKCEKKDCTLDTVPRTYISIQVGSEKWFKVHTLAELLEALNSIGDAKYMLVAGNTAHGVKRRDTDIAVFIDVTSVSELHVLIVDKEVVIGGGTTLTEAMNIFTKITNEKPEFAYLKEIVSHFDLIANVPVRNIGTLAGNLSLKHGFKRFQSDVFLTLETFGAQLKIAHKDGSPPKIVSLMDFLNLDMNGRVIIEIILKPLDNNHIYQSYKIMPRAQNTHAIVNAGFLVQLDSDKNTVKKAIICYGAINTDFVHAVKTEQLLVGKKLYENETLQMAFKTLETELVCDEAPPDPSPEARKQLAISLFYKFVLKTAPNNLVDPRYQLGGSKFDRPVSSGKQEYDTNKSEYPLTQPIPKLEALVQCSGEAKYIVDQDVSRSDYLFAAYILVHEMPGSKIVSINGDEALKVPGVVGIVTAKDVPGRNMYNVPELLLNEKGEIFCSEIVAHYGQPAGLLVAETEDIAYQAAKLVKIQVTQASSQDQLVYTTRDALKIKDNPRIKLEEFQKHTTKGTDVKKVLKGTFDIGTQYHYTMETQACICEPIEDGINVFSSTQWMDLVQTAVAKSINMPLNNVNVTVRRLGGGYGAKIFPSSHPACACAVAAVKLNRPVYFRVRMEDNMESTGKRYPCSVDYEVGVNDEGKIQYLNLSMWSNYGYYTNGPMAKEIIKIINNCYDSSTWDLKGYGVTTDVAGNTYCRAPGSAEGIAIIESIMDHIATELKKDVKSVRLQNMAPDIADMTPLIDSYSKTANIEQRMKQNSEFNKANRWRKRGIGMTVMNYPFFYLGNFYSAVSIYSGDGTVSITHGGIEMGQGINTKVVQVAAYTLGIDVNMIQVKPSNVFSAPNNMVTGGSFGSESVCFATIEACKTLLERMAPIKAKLGPNYSWLNMIQLSRSVGIDLNATYQFTTQDKVQNYAIYGVTFTEVEVDLLTGLIQIERVDLLEDTGDSMSPEVDVGQVEGAFIMGLGYWLMEHADFDEQNGALRNTRTWNYHPPGMKDIPIDWRIEFRRNAPNPNGVLRSKATGEPPFCMSVSVVSAIRQALACAREESDPNAPRWFKIEGPTSTDEILLNSLPNYTQYKLK